MNAPYFDMRLGRMVHPGRPTMAAPNPAQPVGEALGANGSSAGKALLWIALLGAAGYGVYYLYKQSQDEDLDFDVEERDEDDTDEGDAGYWVKLYNYPRGSADRRLKRVEGPFETRAEADRVSRDNEETWYPVVAWSRDNPLDQER